METGQSERMAFEPNSAYRPADAPDGAAVSAPYVGIMPGGKREYFRAAVTPTESEYGARYLAVIGPFRTKRAAEFMRDYGRGNPHCLTVWDAEYLTRKGRP